MFIRLLTAAAVLGAAGAAAVAQPAPPAAQPQQQPGYDPNERICENITMTGSRIAVKRICATRAEWAERRLSDRQDAERIQVGISGSICSEDKASGRPMC